MVQDRDWCLDSYNVIVATSIVWAAEVIMMMSHRLKMANQVHWNNMEIDFVDDATSDQWACSGSLVDD